MKFTSTYYIFSKLYLKRKSIRSSFSRREGIRLYDVEISPVTISDSPRKRKRAVSIFKKI